MYSFFLWPKAYRYYSFMLSIIINDIMHNIYLLYADS